MSEPLRLTPDILESLLVDLDDGEFAAFVADLYERTGRDTERQGSVVTAVTPGGDRERLLVWTDERTRIERLLGTDPPDPDTEGIDAVVSRERDAAAAAAVIAEEYGAELRDADDLHGRLLYAMDRKTRRDLCREHFDRAVEPQPTSEEEGAVTLRALPRPRIALVAVVVCSLLVAGATGPVGLETPDGVPFVTGDDPGTPAPVGSGLVTPVGADQEDTPTPTDDTPIDGEQDTDGPPLTPTDETPTDGAPLPPDRNRSLG